ncbi:MAG TPA: IS4 family transposase [Polyangia bacterium]
MSQACLPLVLEVFAFLFSKRWMGQWQKKWRAQKRLAPGGPDRPKSAQGRFYERIFSLRVTLWYLLFQRLNFDQTQAAVVVNLREGGANRLGRRRAGKLSRRLRSTQTSAYNQARQRMPLALLSEALAYLRQGLLKLVGLAPAPRKRPGPAERTRQILDGSTLAVLVTPRLAAAYPPARNQSGKSDWSLMRIVVGFCARSGAVLSALEGAMQRSEQAMAWTLIEAAAAFTIWIGDRNFGVWSVVAQAVRYRQDVLVRLTRARATKLAGDQPLHSGEDRLIQWSPSRSDQAPPGTERLAVSGRLIYLRLQKNGQWIDLWLFTTLDATDYPVALRVGWYGQRWQAELHFRSVKTQMKLAELDVCTPEMARKEFYAGLLAYSLVRAVMWGAGQRLEGGIKTLSFSQARRVLLERFKTWGQGVVALDNWSRQLLEQVAHQTLPKRSKERPSEVRRVRHRRLKYPPLKGSRAAARTRDRATKSS